MAKLITRKFTMEKATKNTIKFNEDPPKGEPVVIGTLYVQKWAAGDAQSVEVTIEVPD
jgi:hypothetical protein